MPDADGKAKISGGEAAVRVSCLVLGLTGRLHVPRDAPEVAARGVVKLFSKKKIFFPKFTENFLYLAGKDEENLP